MPGMSRTSPPPLQTSDAVRFQHLRADTEPTFVHAVVIDAVKYGKVPVQTLVQDPVTFIYHVSSKVTKVKLEDIVQHVPIGGNHDQAPKAWDKLGFRMLDGERFVKHSDEVGDRVFPIGDASFELISSVDSSESMGSLRDFIVPDEECEPFTHADDSHPWVRDTHAAAAQFDDWVPENEHEIAAKHIVTRIQARAAHAEDDKRMDRNMPPLVG